MASETRATIPNESAITCRNLHVFLPPTGIYTSCLCAVHAILYSLLVKWESVPGIRNNVETGRRAETLLHAFHPDPHTSVTSNSYNHPPVQPHVDRLNGLPAGEFGIKIDSPA